MRKFRALGGLEQATGEDGGKTEAEARGTRRGDAMEYIQSTGPTLVHADGGTTEAYILMEHTARGRDVERMLWYRYLVRSA